MQAFEEISNEMIHVVDAGSSVIDEIGKTGTMILPLSMMQTGL